MRSYLLCVYLICNVMLRWVWALPHVNDCNVCQKCWYDQERTLSVAKPLDPVTDVVRAAENIVPSKEQRKAKLQKPNCEECWGCSTKLEHLGCSSVFGCNFTADLGGSNEWLFMADLPDTHLTGNKAVVKVWCVPVNKGTKEIDVNLCVGQRHARRVASYLTALDKVTADCGLHDIAVRTWVAPVNAVIPGFGVHVYWYGLWMEKAHGVSLHQLTSNRFDDKGQARLLDLMQNKLNGTQVVRAAIYDLLTGQCDRHPENAFIDTNGNIKLIDNINSLKLSWGWCSQDSVFLPGTQKFEIVRYGSSVVGKTPGATRRHSASPLLRMDYRCHVPGGQLGTQGLPPDVKQCLRKLSDLKPEGIQQEYGFVDIQPAEILYNRAKDLLTKGFEWTLKKGEPVNRGPLRYKWHEPCCQLSLTPESYLTCSPAMTEAVEMPLGCPSKGGDWARSGPDTGSYDGDKIWEDLA